MITLLKEVLDFIVKADQNIPAAQMNTAAGIGKV